MSICVGIENKICGKEFTDLNYPDDTLCDECFNELEGE